MQGVRDKGPVYISSWKPLVPIFPSCPMTRGTLGALKTGRKKGKTLDPPRCRHFPCREHLCKELPFPPVRTTDSP